MKNLVVNFRNFPRLMLALAVGLCLVSACARPPGTEEEEPVQCWPCKHLPETWYWDADEDGLEDFEVSCWTYSLHVMGAVPEFYYLSITSIFEDREFHHTDLLYPLEQGQWINGDTEWNEYSGVQLGKAQCGPFEFWEGPFTAPEGDVFAFRIEGTSKTVVGVARFQLWECDGYIDILDLRLESELYGVIVGQ